MKTPKKFLFSFFYEMQMQIFYNSWVMLKFKRTQKSEVKLLMLVKKFSLDQDPWSFQNAGSGSIKNEYASETLSQIKKYFLKMYTNIAYSS